jgi:hypothetical protein
MPRVIHRSIVITLEIVPSGVTRCTAERATAAITSEWLHSIGQQMMTIPSMPTYQIYMRQLSPDQGAYIQIIICWIVLQAQRQEINDY